MFYRKQRGSALIISIFVITIMAAFAMAMIRVDWSNQETTSREVFAARAWFAAHSGNEYVLSKLFPLERDNSVPEACISYTLPGSNFACQSVVVTCTNLAVTRDDEKVNRYQLESKATCGTGKFAVTRIQETWAKDLPGND